MIQKKLLVEEDWAPFFAVFTTLEFFLDGLLFGRKVGTTMIAVKRIERTEVIVGDKSAIHREVEIMEKLAKHHPNILRHICTDITTDFL